MRKKFRAELFLILMFIISVNAAVLAQEATVNIDVSSDYGEFMRIENYGNFSGRADTQNGAIRTKDMKFMNYNGLNKEIMRMWINLKDDFTYYNSSGQKTSSYNDISYAVLNTTIKKHFTEMNDYSEKFLICVQQPETVNGTWSVAETEKKYAAAIKVLVEKFPKSIYYECVNEPDLNSGNFYSTVQQYYEYYYKPHYRGLKTVNDKLKLTGTENELKIGGPVSCMFMPTNYDINGNKNTYYIRDFIRLYKSDTSADKRLDFISYHQYGGNYKGDPAFMGTEQGLVREWLGESYNGVSLDKNLDIFVSETGIFAGNQSSQTDLYDDMFIVAAGVASENYHYIKHGLSIGTNQLYPFMWVPRHTNPTNWRKNMLVTDRTDNSSNAVLYKFTPFGNMFKMFSMLKRNMAEAEVIPSRSGSAGDGDSLGMYAIGTKDSSGIGVMMWNYQYDNRSTLVNPFNGGNVSYDVTLNINNIDKLSQFDNKDVLVKIYRIDDEYGSFAHNGGKLDGVLSQAANDNISIDVSKMNADNANLIPSEKYITTVKNGTVTLNYQFDKNKFRYVELVPIEKKNMLLGKNVISSKPYGSAAANAVDGDMSTRWGAPNGDFPYSITGDLGAISHISTVELDWYNADSRYYQYKIWVSDDNQNFTLISDYSDNTEMGNSVCELNTNARYVKIEVTGASSGWASMYEFKIFGQGNEIQNLTKQSINEQIISKSKEYFASSETYASNPAKNAFDNNSASEWKAGPLTSQHYVGVDLGSTCEITSTEISWYESRSYRYYVEGSLDGENYFVINDRSTNTDKGIITDTANVNARYIRIRVVGSSSGTSVDARIREIKVNGYELITWLQKGTVEKSDENGNWYNAESGNVSSLNLMFDGNIDTRWGVSDGDYPYRINLDLGYKYDISSLETDWYEGSSGKNQRLYKYIVEASADGKKYSIVSDKSNNTDMASTYDSIGTDARYLRITILGVSDGGYASIKEMRITAQNPSKLIHRPKFSDGANVKNIVDTLPLNSITEIANNSASKMNVGMYLGQYDSFGKLIGLEITTTIQNAGESKSYSISADTDQNTYEARSGLWNMDDMTPYTKSTVIYR